MAQPQYLLNTDLAMYATGNGDAGSNIADHHHHHQIHQVDATGNQDDKVMQSFNVRVKAEEPPKLEDFLGEGNQYNHAGHENLYYHYPHRHAASYEAVINVNKIPFPSSSSSSPQCKQVLPSFHAFRGAAPPPSAIHGHTGAENATHAQASSNLDFLAEHPNKSLQVHDHHLATSKFIHFPEPLNLQAALFQDNMMITENAWKHTAASHAVMESGSGHVSHSIVSSQQATVAGFHMTWVGQNHAVIDGEPGQDVNVPLTNVCIQKAGGTALRDIQSLSLSMSPGAISHPDKVTPNTQVVVHPTQANQVSNCSYSMVESKKRGCNSKPGGSKPHVPRKLIDTFGQRTPQYRGVTR